MEQKKVINKATGEFICFCRVAKTLGERSIGLLNRKSINNDEGLYILNCHSIHSFGMRFKFCAVFIDKNNKVIAINNSFKKNRMSIYHIRSKNVLELYENRANSTNLKVGDTLEFVDCKEEKK